MRHFCESTATAIQPLCLYEQQSSQGIDVQDQDGKMKRFHCWLRTSDFERRTALWKQETSESVKRLLWGFLLDVLFNQMAQELQMSSRCHPNTTAVAHAEMSLPLIPSALGSPTSLLSHFAWENTMWQVHELCGLFHDVMHYYRRKPSEEGWMAPSVVGKMFCEGWCYSQQNEPVHSSVFLSNILT